MITLSIYEKTDPLCENFQANEMKFAFVNTVSDTEWKTINTMVMCREYFNEFLMINHHNKFPFIETYGFRYSHDKYPWQMESPKMAVKFTSPEHMKEFIDNISALHHIEHYNKFKPTIIHFVESKLINTIVLEFDPAWTKKCLSFNVYTLVLKLCALGMNKLPFDKLLEVKVKGNVPTELSYLQTLGKPALDVVLSSINLINTTESKYVDGSSKYRDSYEVHGNSGLLYFNYRKDEFDMFCDGMKNNFAKFIISLLKDTPKTTFFKEAV